MKKVNFSKVFTAKNLSLIKDTKKLQTLMEVCPNSKKIYQACI